MPKLTLEEWRGLVKNISAGREVDTDKIARILLSSLDPTREFNFEELPSNQDKFKGLTATELEVAMDRGRFLVSAAKQAIHDRMTGTQN